MPYSDDKSVSNGNNEGKSFPYLLQMISFLENFFKKNNKRYGMDMRHVQIDKIFNEQHHGINGAFSDWCVGSKNAKYAFACEIFGPPLNQVNDYIKTFLESNPKEGKEFKKTLNDSTNILLAVFKYLLKPYNSVNTNKCALMQIVSKL